MTVAVHRVAVPVDDQWHQINVNGPILHVATRSEREVEVWFLADSAVTWKRSFRVFGTGHPLPGGSYTHVGSAITPPDGRFAWHLFESLGGES